MRTKLFLHSYLLSFWPSVKYHFWKTYHEGLRCFVRGTKEDHIYWLLASVEGSYSDGTWNHDTLHETLHWGLMLGFESYIEDASGSRVLSSTDVIFLWIHTCCTDEFISETAFRERRLSVVSAVCRRQGIGKLYLRPLEGSGSFRSRKRYSGKRKRVSCYSF